MRLVMAAFVCTTALAVAACERPADQTQDQPAADTGVAGQPAEPGLMDRMETAVTGERALPEFVREAALANMTEIELGQLAQKRAQSPDVRNYGQRMVKEHTQALNELKKVATTAGVQLPGELDQEHRQKRERLEGLKGPEFDREYLNLMVEAHQDTAELLEPRAEQHGRVGTTGEARPGEPGAAEQQPGEQQASQWAQKTLPTVQQHLEQARKLHERLEGQPARGQGQTQP